MRKSTLFISSLLTIFMLAILYGIVSAYQGIAKAAQSEPVIQPKPAAELQSVERFISLAPAPGGIVTPQQATSLAMQMIGREDVYSVESTEYEGQAAYLVTFASGDLVYVSPMGQILAVTKLEPVIIAAQRRNSRNNNDVQSSGGGEDREDHDEHEDEHEGGND